MPPPVGRAAVRLVLFCMFLLLSGAVAAPARTIETGWTDIESILPQEYMPANRIEKLTADSKLSDDDKRRGRINQTRFFVERPEGRGPFPAVFFLHGCDGVFQEHYRSWDNWFLARGYGFVVVDSWATRGITSVCDAHNRLFPVLRIGDVYATLSYLAAHKEFRIDPRRVMLAGFSNGGAVVFNSLRTHLHRSLAHHRKATGRFVGGFAFYPHCGKGKRPELYNPVFVLVGAEDDWASPENCIRWSKLPSPPGSARLEVHVFPDSFHAFDLPTHISAIFTSGGHLEEYNPIARAKSEDIIDTFMKNLDATLAASRANANRLRRMLRGNTMRLTLSNGRTAFQYFAPDGHAPMVVVGGRRFDDIRWRTDQDGDLCRTNPRSGREMCQPATVEGKTATLYRPSGEVGQKMSLLAGNQLPRRDSSRTGNKRRPPGIRPDDTGHGSR